MTSFYRNVFWFAKGMKEYSRSGFRTACRSFNLPDLDVDCSGKVFMVTGATGTLGKVVAIQLAQKGGTVHLVCKNKDKADALKKTILDITENEEAVVVHVLDLSDPQQVFHFAKSFVESHGILHVLINCASTITHDREIGESGLEKMFATNTLGVHILIKSLLPVLNQSCEPRVVLVTCGSLLMQRLDPVDLQFECMFPYDGLAAFMQTKRHQAVMVEHYAEANPGIHFSAMHPGWLESQGGGVLAALVSGKVKHLVVPKGRAATLFSTWQKPLSQSPFTLPFSLPEKHGLGLHLDGKAVGLGSLCCVPEMSMGRRLGAGADLASAWDSCSFSRNTMGHSVLCSLL